MIIIHETFVCKPGNASKIAKLFNETKHLMPEMTHVLTDMSGQWHRVIAVSQYENLTAYEESLKKWENPTPEMTAAMDKFGDMNEMYASGSREFYKSW